MGRIVIDELAQTRWLGFLNEDIIISMRKSVHFPVDIDLYKQVDNLSSHTQISHNELNRVDNAEPACLSDISVSKCRIWRL